MQVNGEKGEKAKEERGKGRTFYGLRVKFYVTPKSYNVKHIP